jgi:hypothetical protein
MNAQLLEALPMLLPLAEQWAKDQEAHILKAGSPLPEQNLADALKLGVKNPERIRLLSVRSVPLPDNPLLKQAALSTSLISPDTIGLTLRYGIFIRSDFWGNRQLIAHECVHTAQYERLGGFSQFLSLYLKECLKIGYPQAPMEQEAVSGAKRICG